MVYNSRAVIVWIDDHFLTPTFKEDTNKNTWHKLFNKIDYKLYRLLDIKVNFIRTKKEVDVFLSQSDLFKSNTYFYFIVDRKLPYNIGDDAVDSNSEDIIYDLIEYKKKYQCLDFSILSSGAPDSYAIKNLDYYLKPQNKEFTLPDELRHKILLNIKNNIGFIDQTDTYLKNKISCFGNVKKLSTNDIMLYPFLDKFRSYIELEEIVKNDFTTLIVLTNKSTSDKFIQQSLLIALYDNLKDYDGLNYYRDETYSTLKERGFYDDISDISNKIPVIRLDSWSIGDYKSLYRLLKHNLCALIVDQNDDNISNYIDFSKRTRVIKVDGLDLANKETAETILFSLVNKLTNEFSLNLDNSIYGEYPILFFHPIIYRMLTDHLIEIEELNDPSETIAEINTYFKRLDFGNNNVQQKVSNSAPIVFDKEYIYKRCQCLLGDKYNIFLQDTIKYWLKESWNTNYNVSIVNFDTVEAWQKYAFEILKELLAELDLSQLEDIDKKEFMQINNTIALFEDTCIKEKKASYKMMWPHEKYPISIYIQNMLSSNNNKKLYFQNSDYNFIDYSPELIQDFNLLENKINYYRDIFDLVSRTSEYFPLCIQESIQKISNRIQNTEDTFQKNENEEYKQLTNVLLRIAIVFGEAVTGKKINIAENDKAGLGKLAGLYRDQVIVKKNFDLFQVKFTNIICDDSNVEIKFVEQYGTILNNKDTLYKALSGNDSGIFEKNGKLKGFSTDENDENEYTNRLLRADNIDLISQLSTIGSSLIINEQNIKILKYKDCYKLLAYLADTRNMWEHKHNELWNNELFVRFFIYSYESIWLMQKFILEELGAKNLPNTKYVQLNKDHEFSSIRFKSIKEYNEYYNKLYK